MTRVRYCARDVLKFDGAIDATLVRAYQCENVTAKHCSSDVKRLWRDGVAKTGFEGLARGGRQSAKTADGNITVDSRHGSTSNSNLRGGGHRAKPSDAGFGSSAVEGIDRCCAGTLSLGFTTIP